MRGVGGVNGGRVVMMKEIVLVVMSLVVVIVKLVVVVMVVLVVVLEWCDGVVMVERMRLMAVLVLCDR